MKTKTLKYFLIFTLLIAPTLNFSVVAQTKSATVNSKQDTTDEKPHSAKKATLYSTFLPGLGQAYNQQYWKIPIVYAGFGTLIYFIHYNGKNYNLYRDAYINFENKGTKWQDIVVSNSPEEELKFYKDYYRRWLELSVIGTAAWYALNIIDANVYGHLFHFDISKDLTLDLKPALVEPAPYQTSLGISCSFTF